jgi:hypothetical protein
MFTLAKSTLTAFAVLGAASLLFAMPAHAISTRTLIAPLGEAANDQFGRSVSGAGDVNGDGYADVIVGAWGNDAGGSASGRAYVYFGGPLADAVADLTLTGEAASDQFGFSVSGAGDVNGDGYADVIVGAHSNNAGGNASGRAYVYFGGPLADAVADLTLTGEAAFNQFGRSVSGAGDVNGDGYADVIVGAWVNDAGGSSAGRAYVYFGGPLADALADLTLTGAAAGDQFGISVSGAGDVNGDGYADVIVGAYLNDSGGSDAGRAYVYFGGPLADAVADLTLTGAAAVDEFGVSVSGAGDVNGDGYADVVVGAWGNDAGGGSAGRAYVYFGGTLPNSTADLIFAGAAGDQLGISVSDAGDLTGDGLADVIAGAFANDEVGVTAGKAHVYDAYQYIVTAPNGGETWPVGSLHTIRWLGKDVATVSLSTDGGLSYSVLWDRVGGQSANEVQLRVPHAPTRFAMVKIEPNSTGLPGHDRSDSLFTIESSVALLTFTVRVREAGGGAELALSSRPAVVPQGIAGYRLYRSDAGASARDLGRPIGPSLITANTYVDDAGAQGASYRIASVNGLGEELELGRRMLAPAAPLAAWPLPYRGGELIVSFAVFGRLGASTGVADIALYDLHGRRIAQLARGTFAGTQQVIRWNGRDRDGRAVPGGLYFLRAVSGGETNELKIVVAP